MATYFRLCLKNENKSSKAHPASFVAGPEGLHMLLPRASATASKNLVLPDGFFHWKLRAHTPRTRRQHGVLQFCPQKLPPQLLGGRKVAKLQPPRQILNEYTFSWELTTFYQNTPAKTSHVRTRKKRNVKLLQRHTSSKAATALSDSSGATRIWGEKQSQAAPRRKARERFTPTSPS